jgi:hypothetical protein
MATPLLVTDGRQIVLRVLGCLRGMREEGMAFAMGLRAPTQQRILTELKGCIVYFRTSQVVQSFVDKAHMFLPIILGGQLLDELLLNRHVTFLHGALQGTSACLAVVDGGGDVLAEAIFTEGVTTITPDLVGRTHYPGGSKHFSTYGLLEDGCDQANGAGMLFFFSWLIGGCFVLEQCSPSSATSSSCGLVVRGRTEVVGCLEGRLW